MIHVVDTSFANVGSLRDVFLENLVALFLFLELGFQAVERPNANLLVIARRDKNTVGRQFVILSKGEAANEALMGINLELGALLRKIPENNFAIS